MAVPRNRLSNARKNNKRAHHAKTKKNVFACPNCQTLKVSHVVCSSCGHYANKQIVATKEA